MPSSRPSHIPLIIDLVRQLRPASILDIGIGFGKWGHLFREYTDIIGSEDDPDRYNKPNWQVRIDGVEGFAGYVTEMHRFLYDNIHIGLVPEVLTDLPKYDIVFMGDVIEHFEKQAGHDLLLTLKNLAHKTVIVTTPSRFVEQGASVGNPLEIHRSHWDKNDFDEFEFASSRYHRDDLLIAALSTDFEHQQVVDRVMKRHRHCLLPGPDAGLYERGRHIVKLALKPGF